MTLEYINNRDAWDSFVDQSSSGLPFHKWEFLRIIGRHTGYRLITCGIFRDDELICIFPIFHKKIRGLSALFSPPPLQGVVPYLGPVMLPAYDRMHLTEREGCMRTVADGIRQITADIAPNYISFTFTPGLPDARHFILDNYRTNVHYSYMIDLSLPLDEIWSNFNTKLRGKIRKAEGEGFSLVQADDVTPLYNAVSERFNQPDMKVPMIAKSFFTDILSAYPGTIRLYYLYSRDGSLSGAVAAVCCKRFLYWVGNPKMGKASANELLQWLLIREAKMEGHARFENVGANNPSLSFFKSQFNPELEVYIEIVKQDPIGKAAEWLYSTVINKPWMKRRLIPYIE